MQQKKRILLLATGGTIASRKSDNGLKPQITPEELIEYIPQVKEICDVEAVQLLNLDSTNMEPSHWKLMVHAIWEHYDDFDGFVIAHGTDTMAYTAAAALQPWFRRCALVRSSVAYIGGNILLYFLFLRLSDDAKDPHCSQREKSKFKWD